MPVIGQSSRPKIQPENRTEAFLQKGIEETTFISSFPSLPPVQSLRPAGRSSAFSFGAP
jgi:hypothetical protein